MATATRRAAPKARKPAAKARSKKIPVIDIHTHIRVQSVLDFVRDNPAEGKVDARSWNQRGASEVARLAAPDSPHVSAERRLKDMDKAGIDIQVVSMNTPAACYFAEPKKGQQALRLLNEGIAEFCAKAPDRFVGIGGVPMQDASLAVKELDYAVNKLGLKGVSILSNIANEEVGDPKFHKFWARAEKLGVPVFIHPQGFTQPDRLMKFFLKNTIGQPLEEALAMSSLIHEGVLEKYPKLKVEIAHGGGYLPFYPGRSDNAWRAHPEAGKNIRHAPSYYIKKFWYDTVIFDDRQLAYLVDAMGPNRIVMGSDYPWVDWDYVGYVKKSRRIGDDVKERILYKNAAKMLNLSI